MTPQQIISLLSTRKFSLNNEKLLQQEIAQAFTDNGIEFEKEFILNPSDIPDFFMDGIAIEIKIKGNVRKIFKQCQRYCDSEKVTQLILITNRSMGFPKDINGKPCFVLQLGKAWL